MNTHELCDCQDCQESDKPCAMDCDNDEACAGCQESRADVAEIKFEIDWAQGQRSS